MIRLLRFIVALLIVCTAHESIAQTDPFTSAKALSQQQPDSALSALRRVYNNALDKNDRITEGLCLQQMGKVCYNQGHYAQALDFYQRADKTLSSQSDRNLVAANLAEMGVLYYYNKQIAKAKLMYDRAMVIYRQTHNLKGIAEVQGNIGHLYEKQRRYDIAFNYQQQALKNYNAAGFKRGAAKIYENLGSIYEDLGKYDSARNNFNRSLSLYEADQNQVASIEVINNIGDVYRKTGEYSQSLNYTRNAMKLAKQTGNIYQMAASAKDMGQAFELLGRTDSAYYYSELSRRYSLDVYSKEGVEQTAFLQVLYDMNRKSAEIARLNEARIQNRIVGIAVLVVALLSIALGVVVFSRQRLKIKDQQTMARQQQAEHEVVELELKNKRLHEEALKQQLDLNSTELSTHTLNLIRNNQLLDALRTKLQAMIKDDKRDQKKQMQQIILQINESFNHEQNWKDFTVAFEQVHRKFFDNLKQHTSELTSADMRLIALLRINLDSNDIATLLGISTDSLRVSRYRLRKKLNLEQGENLTAFIQSL